jgi:hypothetical protein
MRSPEGAVRLVVRHPWALALGLALQGCSMGDAGAPVVDPLSHQVALAPDASSDEASADVSAPTADSEGADSVPDPMDAVVSDAPASYLAAESVIRASCAFVRCHGGPTRGGAGLWFGQTQSIRGPLVNVPACEYDKMMRVKPGDLANSWVMTKLTAPQDPQTHVLAFSPAADWVPAAGCTIDTTDASGRFGLHMPETGNFELDPDSLSKLVAWIEAGAPGPD